MTVRGNMIVYRFEKNGIGPYVGGTRVSVGSFYDIKAKTHTAKKYSRKFKEITSQVDFSTRRKAWYKAHEKKEYLFGCTSKELLRTYFRGNFKPLFKEGYRIKRYKVPDDQVIDMVIEVAFPVKYHKLQSLKRIQKNTPF